MTADVDVTPGPVDLWTTRAPGTYLLLLSVQVPTPVTVGRLGTVSLCPGWYVYVGSALGGLGPRLRRHARTLKPYHWHIDALREVAPLVKVAARLGRERLECSIAHHVAALPGAAQPVPRFGASDCRCLTHLFHFADEPDLRLDPSWTVSTVTPDLWRAGTTR